MATRRTIFTDEVLSLTKRAERKIVDALYKSLDLAVVEKAIDEAFCEMRKDIYRLDTVEMALEKEAWKITFDAGEMIEAVKLKSETERQNTRDFPVLKEVATDRFYVRVFANDLKEAVDKALLKLGKDRNNGTE